MCRQHACRATRIWQSAGDSSLATPSAGMVWLAVALESSDNSIGLVLAARRLPALLTAATVLRQ